MRFNGCVHLSLRVLRGPRRSVLLRGWPRRRASDKMARAETAMNNLKDVRSHFAFGKNWASYAAGIGEIQIEEAKKGLLKLIPVEDFKDRSFLDIGCGS